MANNSDYKKPRINLFDLLPSVYQSDVNKGILENLHNRFLTKTELEKVVGMIGKKLPTDVDVNLIPEQTTHRQAWQLQPLLYKKVATVDHASSYYDILQQAERLGVDRERLPLWGNTEQFNFIPPIDIDKLINYTSYYWYDPENPGSTPQYITIQNKCTKTQAILNAAIDDVGGELIHPIIGLNEITNELTIAHNFESAFEPGSSLNIEFSTINDGAYTVNSAIYDGNNTIIRLNESVTNSGDWGRVNISSRFEEYFRNRDCTCYGESGWDKEGWDDNDGFNSPIPAGYPVDYPTPDGVHNWDQSDSCPMQNDAWSRENKWVHIADVPNTSIAKRAEGPIIEYLPDVQLNEWSKTTFRWKYRALTNNAWVEVDTEPTSAEIANGYPIQSVGTNQFTVAGDYSEEFTINTQILIRDNASNIISQLTVTNVSVASNVTTVTVVEPTTTITTSHFVLPFAVTSRGDAWLDFFDQWLYVGVKEVVPVEHQIEATSVLADQYLIPLGASGLDLQRFEFTAGNQNKVIKGADDIRVYVNGIREYVTYQELTELDIYGSGDNFYVRGIEFFDPKAEFDLVRIELSAAAEEDVGNELISVRTVEDNTEYETQKLALIQPTLVSLVNYRKVEQTKTIGVHTYPQFNMFTVTGDFYGVSPLFQFLESSDAEINSRLNKRIVTSNFGTNYHFQQHLVDNTGRVYAYKDIATIDIDNLTGLQTIWRKGYGDAEQYVPAKMTADRHRIVDLKIALSDADTETFSLAIKHGDWTDLFVAGSTLTVSDSTADDGLYTVASSSYDGLYTHIVVEEGIGTATQGDGIITSNTIADWEIPNQLYYNASHEDRQEITFSQLLTHFNTIIAGQQAPANIVRYSSSMWRILTNPNYGIGGTIKEHNDSYDTFLSSLFIDSSNPLQIIEFAQNRYETNLNTIQEGFDQNFMDHLTILDDAHLVDLAKVVSDFGIQSFEQNDVNATVYGDSNTFNPQTSQGIRGWIATLPFIRMRNKVAPVWLGDDKLGVSEILHHDGHVSTRLMDSTLVADVIDYLTTTAYSTIEGVWCYSGTIDPETDYNTYFTTYTGRKGKYWYNTSTGKLYRFSASYISASQPAASTALEGALWYNTDTDELWQFQSNVWVSIATGGDISLAWKEIDIEQTFQIQLLEVERRLFDAAPLIPAPIFDIQALETAEPLVFASLVEEAFYDYIQRSEIDDPFSATGFYSATDPFSWNYSGVPDAPIGLTGITTWPTSAANTTKPWGANWWTIYEQIFNTPYPHLEPWKLQGFVSKPVWWDEEYKDLTGARRWIYDHNTTTGMWENIRIGKIPAGRTYPDGTVSTGNALADGQQLTTYNYFCVNIDDVAHGSYGPDDLLPPYLNETIYPSLSTTTNRTLIKNESGTIPTNPSSFPGVTLIYHDYVYGQNGPTEWEYHKSSQFAYDLLKIAYQMQPVRFMHQVWGNDYISVGGLNIDLRTEKVFSHVDTNFHGDLIDNEVYIVPGLSQWYTNFNRYNSIDNKTSDFRAVWTEWEPTLAYQFGSAVETSSFQIAARSADLTDQDYSFVLKRSPGLLDRWVDSLRITTTKFGPRRISSDSGSDWEFLVDIPTSVSRVVKYYDIVRYLVIDFLQSITFGTPTGLRDTIYEYTMTIKVGDDIQIPVSIQGQNAQTMQDLMNAINAEIVANSTETVVASIVNGSVVIEHADTGIGTDITIINDNIFPNVIGFDQYRQKYINEFTALSAAHASTVWKHNILDTSQEQSVLFPLKITGMQNVINFIDGYVAHAKGQGFIFNDSDASETDEETGRTVNWQTETERFIDYMYRLRSVHYDPIETLAANPSFELNPLRNHIWFETDQGIIANIRTGPNQDIFTEQTIYDQYGRPLTADHIRVYREDKKGHITIIPELANDLDPNIQGTMYEYLHIGGIHLFVDGYEHIMLLGDYTVDNNLLYDPFIGLDATTFAVEFDRLGEITQRPNAGGYFLHNNSLVPNFENSVESLQTMYDSLKVGGNTLLAREAQRLLGFQDPSYFDNLGINDRSKFLFWRGLIQHKGSVNSLTALINSKQFEEAELDEFWAYKIAEFGDSDRKEYPEINLFYNDVNFDQLKLHFTNLDATTTTGGTGGVGGASLSTTALGSMESIVPLINVDDPLQTGFIQVRGDDQDRWFEQPDQVEKFVQGADNLFFHAEVTDVKDARPKYEGSVIFESDVLADDVRIVFFQGNERVILPIADTGGPYCGITNEVVTFNGTASEPGIDPSATMTYDWGFGDGDAIVGGSAIETHTYTAPGVYSVTLQVDDGSYQSISTSSLVRIYDRPTANTGGTYYGIEGDTINFNGASSMASNGGSITFEWDFDYNGSTFLPTGSGVLPNHTYSAAGTYIVALRVTEDVGAECSPVQSTIVTTTVEIGYPIPVADPGGPYTALVNQNIQMDGSASQSFSGNPLTYRWDFGDGSSLGAGVNPNHVYTSQGNYVVTLIVNDSLNDSLPASTTATVSVGVPHAEANGPYTVQVNTPLTLTGVGSYDPSNLPLTYRWDVTNDGSYDYTVSADPGLQAHTYTSVGTYTAKLQVDNGTNTNIDTAIVSVISPPPPVANANCPYSGIQGTAINFDSTGSYDPSSLPLTYYWTFGYGGASSTSPNPSYTYPASGTYTATLTVNNGFSTDSQSCTVTVAAPVVPVSMVVDPVNYGGIYSQDQLPDLTPNAWDFTCTVTMSDASTFQISDEASWTNSNYYGPIDANTGVITTLDLPPTYPQLGDYIRATYVYPGNGQTLIAGRTVYIVNQPPVLTSIDVTGNTDLCECGNASTYTATGHYDDGSTANITNDVTWSANVGWVSNINNEFSVDCNVISSNTPFVISATLGAVTGTLNATGIAVGSGNWANFSPTACQGTPVALKAGLYDVVPLGTANNVVTPSGTKNGLPRFVVIMNSTQKESAWISTNAQLFFFIIAVDGSDVYVQRTDWQGMEYGRDVSIGNFSSNVGAFHLGAIGSSGVLSTLAPFELNADFASPTFTWGKTLATYLGPTSPGGRVSYTDIIGTSSTQGVLGFTNLDSNIRAAIALNMSGTGTNRVCRMGNGPTSYTGQDIGTNYVTVGNTGSDHRIWLAQGSGKALMTYRVDNPGGSTTWYSGQITVSGTNVGVNTQSTISSTIGHNLDHLGIDPLESGTALVIGEGDDNIVRIQSVNSSGAKTGSLKICDTIGMYDGGAYFMRPAACQVGTSDRLVAYRRSTSMYLRVFNSSLNEIALSSNYFGGYQNPHLFRLDASRVLIFYQSSGGTVYARVLQV